MGTAVKFACIPCACNKSKCFMVFSKLAIHLKTIYFTDSCHLKIFCNTDTQSYF